MMYTLLIMINMVELINIIIDKLYTNSSMPTFSFLYIRCSPTSSV